jgi:hypothetical protein
MLPNPWELLGRPRFNWMDVLVATAVGIFSVLFCDFSLSLSLSLFLLQGELGARHDNSAQGF